MEKIVDTERASIPAVCRYLRTKQVSVIGGEVVPWESGENAAAAYWCLATSGPAGPDDGLVHPHECLGGRACYRERA